MDMSFDRVYYEPDALKYGLGKSFRSNTRIYPWK